MHGHNWNVSCFLPCKSYIWYFMVGEPPTSSIQWIRTWKWRIHTSPSWWWSEQIFFSSACFALSSLVTKKKNRVFFSQCLQTPAVSQDLFLFFSVPVTAAEKRTRERGWVESNTAQGKQGDGRTVIYNLARHGWQTGTMRGKEGWWGL